jgi:phosphopantetheine--protein transferase-like protein
MKLYVRKYHAAKNRSEESVRFLSDALDSFCGGAEILRTEYGKPIIANATNLHLSVTHTGDFHVCVFAGSNIGIDAEDVGQKKIGMERIRKITARFFHPDEIARLDECLSEDEMRRGFFEIWTRKEAYLKWTGEGIRRELSGFSVFAEEHKERFAEVRIAEELVCNVYI